MIEEMGDDLGNLKQRSRELSMNRLLARKFDNVVRQPPKEGILLKYSPALLRRWQNRVVELRAGVFKYIKEDKTGREVQGTLNFDLYECFVTQDKNKKKRFVITMRGSDRRFEFEAASEAETESWVQTIDKHIRESNGNKMSIPVP